MLKCIIFGMKTYQVSNQAHDVNYETITLYKSSFFVDQNMNGQWKWKIMKQYINNGQLIYCLANFDQYELDVFISIPHNVDIVCTFNIACL